MRNITAGYYLPTEEEYKSLWSTGTFVLDTNTLLNLYRYPDRAREDTFAVFERLAKENRLWIPFQVALEFQTNRIKIIGEQLSRFSKVSGRIAANLSEIESDLAALELDQRDIDADLQKLVQEFRERSEAICSVLVSVAEKHVQIVGDDPIRKRLDSVIGSNVGDPPESQPWLDAIYAEGKDRYAKQIPPGYSDQVKAERPNDAAYSYQGLLFERQYGDLILWKQLLAHVQGQKLSHVVFVTGDRKDDWWWRYEGKTIGPHPSLTEEIRRVANVKVFHMYTMQRLLEQAKTHLNVGVRDESIKEVEQVSTRISAGNMGTRVFEERTADSISDLRIVERAVFRWLREMYPNEQIQAQFPDFPDFIVVDSTKGSPARSHGFQFRLIKSPIGGAYLTTFLGQLLTRGYAEIRENRISEFSVVLVLSGDDFASLTSPRVRLEAWIEQVDTLLKRYPVTSIIVGVLQANGTFRPIRGLTPSPYEPNQFILR